MEELRSRSRSRSVKVDAIRTSSASVSKHHSIRALGHQRIVRYGKVKFFFLHSISEVALLSLFQRLSCVTPFSLVNSSASYIVHVASSFHLQSIFAYVYSNVAVSIIVMVHKCEAGQM